MTITTGNVRLAWRLLRQARAYWQHVAALCVLSLLSTPLALLTPFPLKLAVDHVIGSQPLPRAVAAMLPAARAAADERVLLLAIALVIAIALVAQAQDLAVAVLRTYTAERVLLDFRVKLFAHVQRMSLRYHDSEHADSVYRIQYDASAIQYVTVDGLIGLLSAIVTLAAMVVVTARLDWQLALVALAVCPALVAVSGTYRPRLQNRSREIRRLESRAFAVIQEVLGAVRVVKAFGQEEREAARFRAHSAEGVRAQVSLARLEGWFGIVASGILGCGMAAALFVGVTHVRADALTLGDFLLITGYLAQLYAPLKTISKKASSLQGQLASAERVFALLDTPADVPESRHPHGVARAHGDIAFESVSFAYDSPRTVLDQASFTIAAGTRVAIIGRSGAGKTTVANLLMRFYDPQTGRILLDGVDLRDYRLVDLRRQYSMVLQDTVLFSTTIADNIAYAKPDASRREIIDAAESACAHEFIEALPNGYDTIVGERGMRLSGGERQRVALARAFLKNAPLLILDEPTSAVDVRAEADMMRIMTQLMRDRTTFLIAHRLTALQHCDVALLLEGGRVIEVSSDIAGAFHAIKVAEPPLSRDRHVQ